MKRPTILWLISAGVLIAIIGWEMVWAINTIKIPAQQLRKDALEKIEQEAPQGGPVLLLSPPLKKLERDQTFNVDIILQPNGASIIGVDLVLRFDPAVLSVTDAVAAETGIQIISRESKLTPVVNKVDHEDGEIVFRALTPPNETITVRSVIATIMMRANAPGRTKLFFIHIPGDTKETNTTSKQGDVLDRTLNAEYVVE